MGLELERERERELVPATGGNGCEGTGNWNLLVGVALSLHAAFCSARLILYGVGFRVRCGLCCCCWFVD